MKHTHIHVTRKCESAYQHIQGVKHLGASVLNIIIYSCLQFYLLIIIIYQKVVCDSQLLVCFMMLFIFFIHIFQ